MAHKRKAFPKEYVELPPTEKLKLLNEHSLKTADWSSLEECKWCLHCEQQFTGQSVRIYRGSGSSLQIECGTLDCDGSPVDWADYPWWDESHPETIAADKAMDEFLAGEQPEKPQRKK